MGALYRDGLGAPADRFDALNAAPPWPNGDAFVGGSQLRRYKTGRGVTPPSGFRVAQDAIGIA